MNGIKVPRTTFFIIVSVLLTLNTVQLAIADFLVANDSETETVWITYSVWRPDSGNWPEGWRTQGWYEIKPGSIRNLSVPQHNSWVYIRVESADGVEVKPPDHATRDSFPFWIHPFKSFTVVETDEGEFLKSNRVEWNLETADFYEYPNGGSHTITDEPDQDLPDLPAQEVYDQAINSVVWIHAGDGIGSGVLIDKRRKLVVTNQHVTDNTVWVDVFFPWQDQNGTVNKNKDFYEKDKEFLKRQRYFTQGKVIAQSVRNDLAIIQLVQIPTATREIKHDFSENVEDSMRQGDKVHIFGNPGERLWNWTEGTFVTPGKDCLLSGGDCLELEADVHEGNSGGPVLNGQGMLIGIITDSTDETLALASLVRNVKALLDTVPANLVAIHPRRVFKIRNNTGVTVPYQIKWSNNSDWKSHSLETGFIRTHMSNGQNVPSGYPKIRFDHIAGDGQVTYRYYTLEIAQFRENNNSAPTYRFEYNRWGDRLDLVRDILAAPALSKAVAEETTLLSNYPNPFNPETWIPYQLSKPAEVTVTIHAADGRLIRTLALGHQPAGVYRSRERAAYWDGRNQQGETVMNGVYFYTLTAGDFTATRKMLIGK